MVAKIRGLRRWPGRVVRMKERYEMKVRELSREPLQHIVNEYERACDSVGLKINVGKSKVLVDKMDQRGSCEKVRVSGEECKSGQV